MKRKEMIKKAVSLCLLAGMVLTLIPATAKADNPIVQTYYTCDPSPVVFGDTVYLYTTHDEDTIIGDGDSKDFFTMHNWKCFSSKDMVNWTDHGIVMGNFTFDWGTRRAWAGQCMEYKGKYYFFIPLVKNDDSGYGIGIGVSDTPEGPYEDYLGHPVCEGDWNDIDPTVYEDDDGQVYLYFGQSLKYVKLNEDLTDYDRTIGNKGFVSVTDINGYIEGPWFYKRDGHYYMVYASHGSDGEGLSYAMSDGPTGPWTSKGFIMDSQKGPIRNQGSFTVHPGVVDFKGKSYLFYHNSDLNGGYSYHRSVCIEEFTYNDDGTINAVNATAPGCDAVDTINPFQRVEAETICWEQGIKTEHPKDMTQSYVTDDFRAKYPGIVKHYFDGVFTVNDEGKYDVDVYNIHEGDYIKVRNVDFGNEGAVKFNARVSDVKADANASIDIYIKDANEEVTTEKSLESLGLTDSDKIGSLKLENGIADWKELSTKLDKKVTGAHDMYFVFRGSYDIPQREIDFDKVNSHEAWVSEEDTGMFKFDSWSFEKEPVPTAVTATAVPATAVPAATAAPTVVVPATATPAAATASPVPDTPLEKANFKLIKNVKPRSVNLTLKKVNGAKGYQVVSALNSKFTKNKRVKTLKSLKLKLSNLKKGRTYYFKCRAYKLNSAGKRAYGSYGKIVKLKIRK